ncbi:MAG: addiction module protein [Lentisphaeria bacterium]|nr:addiction module protein [Lentisphaeria bacterium]NQZ66605.1 addiction module protein [Lentisphaeria bacterium]
MSNSITVSELSLDEKIRLMEELWQSLSSDSEFKTPEWHNSVLDSRLKAYNSNDIPVSDWETAKEDIRNSIQ